MDASDTRQFGYTVAEVRQFFNYIEKDKISPKERALIIM